MPYPNEHSCRLKEPGSFKEDSFRRIVKNKLAIIIGRLKGEDTTTAQAYRYSTDNWTEEQARKHCKESGGEFHPATGEEKGETQDFSDPQENDLIP